MVNFPSSRMRRALLPLAAALALMALVGCQAREHVPSSLRLLLNPQRQSLQYRRLVLPNQLRVMLISDPTAERSAAAMTVGAGSLEDPADHPGMAHFLEHMLFLGTEKYPEPGSYQAFMASHAGYSNAYTADDHTTFFFQVADAAYPEALERFSQFFIAPTFAQEYAQRELNAVSSEHAKNMENDFWRVRQIQRDQFNPAHPIHHFATGNVATLTGVGQQALRAFYEHEYSANRMTLALVGSASLDALEKLARQRFGPVLNRDLPTLHYPRTILAPASALRLLTVDPVRDVRSLTMEFPLPPVEQLYRAKPLDLIGFVLGHEGQGSLLSLLKAQGLATSLSAGEDENTRDYASFSITVGLTPQGLQQYQQVLREVLGAIQGLRERGIPRYVFEQNQVMAELAFRYQERQESADLAEQTSAQMQVYPLEQLPEAPYLLADYDPALYERFLGALTPDNMLVTLLAKGLPANRVEPFYQARYAYQQEPGAPYQELAAAHPDPRWHRPLPNPYIPRQAALLTPHGALRLTDSAFHYLQADGAAPAVLAAVFPYLDTTFPSGQDLVRKMRAVLPQDARRHALPLLLQDSLALPTRLLDTERARVWYLPDWRLRQPKAALLLKFYVAGAFRSPRDVVLAQLYELGIEEALNEFGYPVKQAGLDYDFTTLKAGTSLSLSGYSPHMLDVLQELAQRMRNVDITPQVFAALKDGYRRGLQNRRFAEPYQQAQVDERLLLEQPSVPDEALLEVLGPVTLEQVQEYARHAFDRVYVQGVVVGNLEPEQARQAILKLLDTLGSKPLPAGERVEERVQPLPPGADSVLAQRLAVSNSLALVYSQAGQTTPTLRAALQLISRPLGDSYYFNLRTQQQLGYIVYAGMSQLQKTLGLAMLAQSGSYPADVLLARSEAFVPKFIAQFQEMPQQAFDQYRTAVLQSKLERDKTLDDTAQRLFYTAFRNDADWDSLSEDVRATEALRKPVVLQVLRHTLAEPGRRRLVIQLFGKDAPARPARGRVVRLPQTLQPAG